MRGSAKFLEFWRLELATLEAVLLTQHMAQFAQEMATQKLSKSDLIPE